MVCSKEAHTGELIANQIALRNPKMLSYIHQTLLSSWRVEGGSGDETMLSVDQGHGYINSW